MTTTKPDSYWTMIGKRFYKHRLGRWSFYILILFCLAGIYAPLLASSKPLFVLYDGTPYFPLFRYLFYSGFYTKWLDIFFNILMFTFPLFVLTGIFLEGKKRFISWIAVLTLQLGLFFYYTYFPNKDPASDKELNQLRHQSIQQTKPYLPNWESELKYLNSYAKLNEILRYHQRQQQYESLKKYPIVQTSLVTLWQMDREHEKEALERLSRESENNGLAKAQLNYLRDRKAWLESENQKLSFIIMPLLSHFHWEDDAGGQQTLNQQVPWWKLTRINRKDLLAALIFGIRISLTVGIISVALALAIGIPIGAFAGFYGGKWDIIVSRLLEIWEAMPVFFMLLLVVALLQSKSIFLVTAVIGFFGWTHFSRYIRGEFFKQRNLSYVEACHALGFRSGYIMFKHILPNAIPPILTLLPFAIMGAITAEAGLSFLGLGEEGSTSWGVLMDEGRSVFPAESYLLWPPAILLTILLIAIALVGDSLRDTLDPKLHR